MSLLRVRNNCAAERIDPRYVPLIGAAVTALIEIFGEELREVRLQGSVARGDAVMGQSDLDLMGLLADRPAEDANARLQGIAGELGRRFALVSRVDLEALRLDDLVPFQRFVLSSDSLSVYGADHFTRREQWLDRLTLARMVTPDITVMATGYRAWIEELVQTPHDDELRFACRIVGKDLLKALRYLTLLRGSPYESAVDRMHGQVARYAPEFADLADQLLTLYRRPSLDHDRILAVITEVQSAVLPAIERAHSR